MQFLRMEKVRDGKYLKNYELIYKNKSGKEKVYEMVSRKELKEVSEIGRNPSGVSIIATSGNKMLLLHEFRMGVNKFVYNLCAGMLEENETIEECIQRELFEETGLAVEKIIEILPPSYAAVAISDTTTYIAFVEVKGNFSDHSSENELIEAKFYSKEELKKMLVEEEFSSRAQLAAYYFCCNGNPKAEE